MRVTLKLPEVLARLQEKVRTGTSTKRDRLVALLGRLGSDHDGEVATAARMVTRLLGEMDLTWDYVLRQEGDGGITIRNDGELTLLKTRLRLMELMMEERSKDCDRLRGEVAEFRRRVERAEAEAESLREALARGIESGVLSPGAHMTCTVGDAVSNMRAPIFDDPYADVRYRFQGGPFDGPRVTEMKSKYYDSVDNGDPLPTVHRFNGPEVRSILYDKESPQAAHYCLNSVVKWSAEETTFLSAMARQIIISRSDLLRLRDLLKKAKGSDSKEGWGRT